MAAHVQLLSCFKHGSSYITIKTNVNAFELVKVIEYCHIFCMLLESKHVEYVW